MSRDEGHLRSEQGHPFVGAFRVGLERQLRSRDGAFIFSPVDLRELTVAGITWDFLNASDSPVTSEQLRDLDAFYLYSVAFTAESLEGIDRLALVARHGVGLDSIDLDACTRRGVAVSITPEAVIRPMASAAVTLILSSAHRLGDRSRALRIGDWAHGRFHPRALGLKGRTLGVIGYGRIGREVANLMRPWEMDVLVSQRTRVTERGVQHVALEDLLARSDVVVITCPLTPETRHLINRDRLGLMKPTAFLVNVSRGEIVDTGALYDALRREQLAGVGLDVFDPEPIPAESPLLSLPNVIATPHSLGYTDDLVRDCVQSVCASVLSVADGRPPTNLANPEVLESDLFVAKLDEIAARRGLSAARLGARVRTRPDSHDCDYGQKGGDL